MKNIHLNNYISSKYINNIIDFCYADINGIAETIGWQIELFRLKKDAPIEAISFSEIFNDILLVDIANKILKDLDFPIKMQDNFVKIKNIFGKETSKDNIFYEIYQVNVTRYHYFMSKNYFITFSISNNKLIGLELIYNKDIINNILLCRNIQ